jgi:hypothetical protein
MIEVGGNENDSCSDNALMFDASVSMMAVRDYAVLTCAVGGSFGHRRFEQRLPFSVSFAHSTSFPLGNALVPLVFNINEDSEVSVINGGTKDFTLHTTP